MTEEKAREVVKWILSVLVDMGDDWLEVLSESEQADLVKQLVDELKSL